MDTTIVDQLVGTVLDSRYRVEQRIAIGGMATVYRAVDLRLDRTVALKVMKPEFAGDPAFVQRFQTEARAAAKLFHPNAVGVFDQGTSNGHVYLAMEFVPGPTLRQILTARGALSPSQALAVVDPVLQGVAAAHAAGFVHRDIKPENVLVPPNGPIKVTDFGLARALQAPSQQTKGMLIGTAAYLSPEQVSSGDSDERTDVYQGGILLFEMISGQLPHTGDTAWSVAYSHVNHDVPPLRSVAPAAPPALEALIASACARDPQDRIPSVAVFLQRVRELALTLPPAAPLAAQHDTVVTPAPPAPTNEPPPRVVTEEPPEHQHDEGGEPQEPAVAVQPGGTDQDPPVDEDDASGGRRRRRLVLPVLVIVGVLLLGWLVAYNPFNRTDIPDVIGMAESRAVKVLEGVGFSAAVLQRDYSETVPADTIISTDPEFGASAHTGSEIGLVVSKGPERYSVPNVKGDTTAEARAALEGTNLIVAGEKDSYSDRVEEGLVVGTKPGKGSEVRRDAEITLLISKGPAPVDVPDVVGMSQSAAKQVLKENGLKANAVGEEFSENVAEGGVVATSPSSGTRVHRTDTIDLTLSKGPPPVEVPNVVDMQRGEAVSKLQSLGFKVKVDEGIVTPLDRVYSQDPTPGTMLSKGSTITLSIF
ncbi:MAG: Stk1 family PASTA domain-containing Ser/Thr kinase [Actinobacteria bacterium]|nr:Stk1 family PASTA domain-containing Ser/Thr kinase [Actinomycetota bacterium]